MFAVVTLLTKTTVLNSCCFLANDTRTHSVLWRVKSFLECLASVVVRKFSRYLAERSEICPPLVCCEIN